MESSILHILLDKEDVQMRIRGGKKMQAISNKYSNIQRRTPKVSERFEARVEIAQEVSRNLTALNNQLCSDLCRTVTKEIYGKSKR